MKNSKIAFGVVVYFIFTAFTFASLFANLQNVVHDDAFNRERCRQDMSMAMLFGLLPNFMIIAPFVTGFYEHGLKWSCSNGSKP